MKTKTIGKSVIDTARQMQYDTLTLAEFYAARGYEKPKKTKKKKTS